MKKLIFVLFIFILIACSKQSEPKSIETSISNPLYKTWGNNGDSLSISSSEIIQFSGSNFFKIVNPVFSDNFAWGIVSDSNIQSLKNTVFFIFYRLDNQNGLHVQFMPTIWSSKEEAQLYFWPSNDMISGMLSDGNSPVYLAK